MGAAIDVPPAGTLKQRIIDFVRAASTEITPHDEGLVPALARVLPPQTIVYVAHTPKASLQDVVRVALCLERAGLRASPHIAARRIESTRDLREAARELSDGGVGQALLIAGDGERAVGPFSSSLHVLECGVLTEAGIRKLGVAGHPEGHRSIGPSVLWESLLQKQRYAVQGNVAMHIVTQFGFDPNAICIWLRHLKERSIGLPVHIGMAGPAPLSKLINYAMQCGVGASLRGVLRNMPAMRNLVGLATSPDEMIARLLIECPIKPTAMVAPHFYSFGGAMATARWVRAISDGLFELLPGGTRFSIMS